MRYLRFLPLIVSLLFANDIYSQITIDPALEVLDYNSPRTYEIGEITVSGTQNLDHSALATIAA
ncbi:MAG: hypothetical protein JKY48_20545, partial [Flavobacteriales bacterium]|nr:hypothetical protein [Flavobacteriales bacterium]